MGAKFNPFEENVRRVASTIYLIFAGSYESIPPVFLLEGNTNLYIFDGTWS